MRYRVWMVEGGETRSELVALRHFMAFIDAHDGRTLDEFLGRYGSPPEPWESYLPWIAHHVLDDSGRTLDEFLVAVDDVGLKAEEESEDPSGGETGSASTASPKSPPTPQSRGRSSSGSTTASKKRSSTRSQA